ncbi:MAG TPA: hypothetical protein VM409_02350, partial [Chloroflexia bacterium]|nr:hypothetical protein [Chloroflexia bacterium]
RRFAGPLRTTRPEFRLEQLAWAWDNLAPPLTSTLDIGGNDLGYIKGFQSPETEQDSSLSFRWTTGQSWARMVAPEGAGRLVLVVRWHSLAWPGKPDPNRQVQVRINGVSGASHLVTPGWEEGRIEAGEIAANSPVIVELLTKAERPPGAETRLLGIAVDSLRLERER